MLKKILVLGTFCIGALYSNSQISNLHQDQEFGDNGFSNLDSLFVPSPNFKQLLLSDNSLVSLTSESRLIKINENGERDYNFSNFGILDIDDEFEVYGFKLYDFIEQNGSLLIVLSSTDSDYSYIDGYDIDFVQQNRVLFLKLNSSFELDLSFGGNGLRVLPLDNSINEIKLYKLNNEDVVCDLVNYSFSQNIVYTSRINADGDLLSPISGSTDFVKEIIRPATINYSSAIHINENFEYYLAYDDNFSYLSRRQLTNDSLHIIFNLENWFLTNNEPELNIYDWSFSDSNFYLLNATTDDSTFLYKFDLNGNAVNFSSTSENKIVINVPYFSLLKYNNFTNNLIIVSDYSDNVSQDYELNIIEVQEDGAVNTKTFNELNMYALSSFHSSDYISIDSLNNIFISGGLFSSPPYNYDSGILKLTTLENENLSIGENKTIDNLNLYPNPCVDDFQIEVDNSTKVEIFKLNGQKVSETVVYEGKNVINSSLWDSGVYILKFIDLTTGNQVFKRLSKL